MAIAATTGTASNNSGSVASLALSAISISASNYTLVTVTLGSTASAVTGITDTRGNTYTLKASVNGTGVRQEIWGCANTGAQASNIITIAISPNTSISACAEEYSGVSSFGNTATASGSSNFPEVRCTLQEGRNFVIGGIGFACVSGDTLTAFEGTSKQSSIPAATAVGGALYDVSMTGICSLPYSAKISTSRNWAMAAVELRVTGGAAINFLDYTGPLPVMGAALDKEIRLISFKMPTNTLNPAQGSGPSSHGWAY